MQVLAPAEGRVRHFEDRVVRDQLARVAHLPARFRVERSAIEDDDAGLSGGQQVDLPDVTARQVVEAEDPRIRFERVVPHELHSLVDAYPLADVRIEARGRTRALALLLHFDVEAIGIDREPTFARDVRREVDRKTEGVVQAKDDVTGNLTTLQAGDALLEQLHAERERFGEPFFFGTQYGRN